MQRRSSMAVGQLLVNPRNARTHSRKQIHQIACSIREFGFQNPILVDERAGIIAGHGRLAAAKELGLSEVPVIEVRGLSEAKKRALALADNKIADNAGWDLDMLALELQELSQLDLTFDLEVTGFDTAELDLLIDDTKAATKDDPADLVPPTRTRAVSRAGDLWLLGEHRLLCGDAREGAGYLRLLDGEKASMCFSAPCSSPTASHRNDIAPITLLTSH
jgi:ParB-like chromosome segregation protein Spo0J